MIPRFAMVALLSTTFAVLPVGAQTARVSGQVVDETGRPVSGLTLRFVPYPGPGDTVPPVEVKKGRFVVPMFPRGAYRIELANEPFTIRHMLLEIRGADGARIGKLDVEVAPGQAPQPFEVSPSQRADITLTLGPPVEDIQGRAVGIQAAAENSTALRRLNELLVAGDMGALLAEADRTLAKDPQLGGAHYLRAVALWKLGRAADAADAIRRAGELIPDQPDLDNVMGSIFIDLGDQQEMAGNEQPARRSFDEAAAAFGRVVAQTPGDQAAMSNQVIALDRAGRTDETIAALRKLIAADPSNAKAVLRLADVLSDAGRNEEAIAVLSDAPSPNEDAATALYNVSVRLYNAKKLDPIRPAMELAIKIAPDMAHAHRLLSRVLLNQGDVPGAVRELKEFLRLAPDDPDAPAERETLKSIE